MDELAVVLGFRPNRSTLLLTFHPATLEVEDMPRQAAELTAALQKYTGPIVITALPLIPAVRPFAPVEAID